MEQKIRSLQGLRGWAILMIVLWHLNSLYPGTLPKLGDRGVEFFLLISGFLIARKCDGPAPLDTFRSSTSYVLRKIKSSYWLFILPAVPVFILDVLAGPQKIEVPVWQLLSFCTLTQSWIPDARICWGVSRTGWFLPVILFCYLMTPLIRKTVRRFGARSVLLVCLAVQVASELLAKHFLPEFYYEWLIYICPAYRVLDFTLGFCAWHLSRAPGRQPSPHTRDIFYIALLAILTGLSLLRPVFLKYVLFHPFEIALLLIIASEKSPLANLVNRNRPIVRLGDLSRVIFFTHVPLIRLTGMAWRRLFGPDLPFPQWIVSLLLVLLAGYCVQSLLTRKSTKPTKKAPAKAQSETRDAKP